MINDIVILWYYVIQPLTEFIFIFPGGYPLPRLVWSSNPEDPESHPIDTTYELTSTSDATQNALVVKTLSRDLYKKTFWCLASNNNVTQPSSTNVTVDLKCKSSLTFNVYRTTGGIPLVHKCDIQILVLCFDIHQTLLNAFLWTTLQRTTKFFDTKQDSSVSVVGRR